MTKFVGTVEEFNKFIGPRIRNKIQALTKRRKKELNHICQICGEKRELEAAHVTGKERKGIIKNILKEDKVNVNLEEIENKIMEAHKPLDKYFKFLCSKCHAKYDSRSKH